MSQPRSPLSGFFAKFLVVLWWVFVIGFIVIAFLSTGKTRF
jgi:hypothetical protein